MTKMNPLTYCVRVAGDAGCEWIHNEKRVQRIKFVFALQERRGAWCGELHQPQEVGALSSYWIIVGLKKGGVPLCGPWAVGASSQGLQFVPMLSSTCGCREQLVLFLLSSHFQSRGQTQKSKMAVMFTKVTGLLGKWGWRCPFRSLSNPFPSQHHSPISGNGSSPTQCL